MSSFRNRKQPGLFKRTDKSVLNRARQQNVNLLRRIVQQRVRPNMAINKFSSMAFRGGQETKTLDVLFTGAYALGVYTPDTVPLQMLPINTTTNVVQCLNLVQQGAGIGQRIGNKISMKSIRVRLAFTQTAIANEGLTGARIMIIYDRQPNGAYPATNTILSDSLQNNTISTGIFSSNLNPNFFDRMVVLKDDFIPLSSWQANLTSSNQFSATADSSFTYDHHIKLRNLESQFNGTANPLTIAYLNIGALYIVVYGDGVANTSDPWQLRGTARLRFRDN